MPGIGELAGLVGAGAGVYAANAIGGLRSSIDGIRSVVEEIKRRLGYRDVIIFPGNDIASVFPASLDVPTELVIQDFYDGKVYRYSGESGKVIKEVTVGSTNWGTMFIVKNKIYYAFYDGEKVVILDSELNKVSEIAEAAKILDWVYPDKLIIRDSAGNVKIVDISNPELPVGVTTPFNDTAYGSVGMVDVEGSTYYAVTKSTHVKLYSMSGAFDRALLFRRPWWVRAIVDPLVGKVNEHFVVAGVPPFPSPTVVMQHNSRLLTYLPFQVDNPWIIRYGNELWMYGASVYGFAMRIDAGVRIPGVLKIIDYTYRVAAGQTLNTTTFIFPVGILHLIITADQPVTVKLLADSKILSPELPFFTTNQDPDWASVIYEESDVKKIILDIPVPSYRLQLINAGTTSANVHVMASLVMKG